MFWIFPIAVFACLFVRFITESLDTVKRKKGKITEEVMYAFSSSHAAK